MNKIAILGAGVYQVPLIKKAKEMNLFTIVISIPGNYPGFPLADKVYYTDTKDLDAVLKICEEEQVVGVAVCGTDVCVPTQGYVCDKLGLKGPTYNSALLSQDKSLMKKAFANFGVRTADVRYVDLENDNPESICLEIGYPVIFKAVDSSGSRGITKVSNKQQIKYAYDMVKEHTHSNQYLIEKYLDGEEFGAQAFIYEGDIKFVLPHGDYVFQGDTGVPIGHYAPFEISSEIIEDAKEQLKLAISALSLNNCAINADFILCDGKTYVLEIGARSGATCLVEMTSIFYGFDYYEKIIQAAIGVEPHFKYDETKTQPNAEILIISSKSGKILNIESGNLDNSNIIEVSYDYSVGDYIHKFKKGPDRIGQIITIGKTVEEAKNLIDKIMGEMTIDIEEQ